MPANIRTSLLGIVAAIGGLLVAWSPASAPWVATVGGLMVALGSGGGLMLAADAPRPAPAAPEAKAPTVPPVVSALFLAFALAGCAHPLDTAITAANVGRDVGLAAHDAIEAYCVPAYHAAADKAALASVDAACVPAEKAYRVYAAAHAASVVAIQRAQLGLATEADALATALAVGRAGADLAAAVKAVSK